MEPFEPMESVDSYIHTDLVKAKQITASEFWSKRLCHIPSTFGASEKQLGFHSHKRQSSADDLLAKSTSWMGKDSDGVNHGRLQLISMIGKMVEVPGPGQYDPNDLVLSKREIGPRLSISKRIPPRREVILQPKRPSKSSFPPLIQPSPPPKESDLKNISVNEMRAALTPGPGARNSPKSLESCSLTLLCYRDVSILRPRTDCKV